MAGEVFIARQDTLETVKVTVDGIDSGVILPKASDGYSADVANMDVAINRKISDNMPDDIMPVSEYLDLYERPVE